MGRTPHIQPGAKSTTVYLTKVQKLALRKFQTKRLEEGEREPGLTEVFLEGFRLLLEREGSSPSELEHVFPDLVKHRANVSVFTRKARRRS